MTEVKNGQFTHDYEVLDVTEKLAKLDPHDVNAFFVGFARIRDALLEKKQTLEEEHLMQQESLPDLSRRIKETLRSADAVREEVVTAVGDAERESLHRRQSLESKAPEVQKALNELRQLKERVNVLKFSKVFRESVEKAMIMIDARSFCDFRQAYQAISSLADTEETFVPTLTDSFKEEFQAASKSMLQKLNSMLFERFVAIRFPFQTVIDHNVVKPELDIITDILKSLHVVYQKMPENERVPILELVFNEFSKRFKFNFYGDKKTNAPEKPEWFFAEISSWIAANLMFMEGHLQPLLCDIGESNVSVAEEFIETLVCLAAEKIRNLLSKPDFVSNSRLVSHLVDETVSFEKELQDVYLYPESAPHAISALCRSDVLELWLEMERDTISSGVDSILSDAHAYDNRFNEASDLDEYMAPNFVDAFVFLMQAMSERYRAIPDERIQCRFLKLQLMVVDEFRSRMVQIGQVCETPFKHPYPQLMNAFWFMTDVLDDWSSSAEFIRLQNFLDAGAMALRGTFDEQSSLYRHVWRQRARTITEHFVDVVAFKLNSYATVKWFQVDVAKPTEVTPQFMPFLLEVERFVAWLTAEISPISVLTLYHLTNHEIWSMLLDRIVSQSNFNSRGAAQMLFDVTTALIPLLETLYKWPKATAGDGVLNKKCIELLNTLKLLSLPSPAAILLKEEIERIPEQMVDEKLNPFDVSGLSKERVLDLFKQRCDMSSLL